jgi:hypothetical protein
VNVQIDNDDKEGVTVIASIDAAGNKLPLTVIGKGKTKRCLAGFRLPGEIWGQWTESGWTTSEVLAEYLQRLRHEQFPEGPIVLILDTYSAHRSAAVKAVAEQLGIELIFIPPGCTDRLQPLDRKVFGVLKSYSRQIWRKRYHLNPGEKVTRPKIAEGLVEAWNRITPEISDSAWDIFDPIWEPADDEGIDLADGEYRELMSVEDWLDM